MFESRGELKPYYDARIETHFALEWKEKDMFTIGREHYDSSTTYIMEKTGANIGFFPFLYKLDKAGEEDMYSYTIVCKQINWDTGGMSLGMEHDLVSKERLINDMSNYILNELENIQNRGIVAEVTSINKNKIIFKGYPKYSDKI